MKSWKILIFMLIASIALVSCENTEQAETEHAPVFSTFIENSHTESKERIKKSKNTSQSGSNEQSNGNIKIDVRQIDVPQYYSAYHTFSHSDYNNPEVNQNNNGDGYSTISYSTYYNGHDYNIKNGNTNSNDSSADQAQQVGSSNYYTNYNENTNENRNWKNQYSDYYNPSASVENGIYNNANNVYYPSNMNHNNGKPNSGNDYNYDAPDNANGNSPFYNNAYSTADIKNGYNTYYTVQHSSAQINNDYTGNGNNYYNNEPLNSVNVHGSSNNNAYNPNAYNEENSNKNGYSEINGEHNTFSYNNIPNNNNAQTNSYNTGYANANYNNVTNLNNSDKFKTIYYSNVKGDKYYNVANTNEEYVGEIDSYDRNNNGFPAIKSVEIKTNKKKIRTPSAIQNAENKHHYKIIHYKPRTPDSSTAGKKQIRPERYVYRYVDAPTVPSNKYNSTSSTGASDSDGAGSSPSESVSFPSNYLSGYSGDLSGELDELENGYSPELTDELIEDVEKEVHDQVHHAVPVKTQIIERPVPYPVDKIVPVPITLVKHVPYEKKVHVPIFIERNKNTVHVHREVPVKTQVIERPVPYPVDKIVPVPITLVKHVPYEKKVHVPIFIERPKNTVHVHREVSYFDPRLPDQFATKYSHLGHAHYAPAYSYHNDYHHSYHHAYQDHDHKHHQVQPHYNPHHHVYRRLPRSFHSSSYE